MGKPFFDRIKHKYRLVLFNDQTIDEKWHIRMSILDLVVLIGSLCLLGAGIMLLLVLFTPLRGFIPVHDEEVRGEIYASWMRLDSLEQEINKRDRYTQNVLGVLSGTLMEDSLNVTPQDTSINYQNIEFTRSPQDSLLRLFIEEEEKFNFSSTTAKDQYGLSGVLFFSPIKGLITSKYDYLQGHFGIDVVGTPNVMIKSVLDGTVIFAGWTFDTGQVIQIQHENDLISVYKHNSRLLKKVGDMVNAGEAISIMGNSGEFSSGPHLHFELWYKGKPLNPEDYITF